MNNRTPKHIGAVVFVLMSVLYYTPGFAQDTTLHSRPALADSLVRNEDSALRIRNLEPYLTLHVDSTLMYALEINKDPHNYFWFLKNAPVGLKINKESGLLSFRADKSYFLSGKLKYDFEYKVRIGVQNLNNPSERVDTSFTLVFFTTEIIPSRVKPTVSNTLYIDEGDTVSFKVQCEAGSFPIESITFVSNVPIKGNSIVRHCDDDFTWSPPYDFIKETDSIKQRMVMLSFIGSNKFFNKDTAIVRIYVKDALDYGMATKEYNKVVQNYNRYILQLKYAFLQLDRQVKHTKNTRTTFDMTTATTALGGTVLSSSSATSDQNVGRVLPSVGVALVPVKEAVAPTQSYQQNSASLVRGAIKRMEYTLTDNSLTGDRDPDVVKKTNKLKEELKQTQIQLIDLPVDEANSMTAEQLNEYFNSPKVNKKYRLKKGK